LHAVETFIQGHPQLEEFEEYSYLGLEMLKKASVFSEYA